MDVAATGTKRKVVDWEEEKKRKRSQNRKKDW